MSKTLVDSTGKTNIKKFTTKQKMEFKGKHISFRVRNDDDWKYQMPIKRNSEKPFYVLTFRNIDPNKTLEYLRKNFSLENVLPR